MIARCYLGNSVVSRLHSCRKTPDPTAGRAAVRDLRWKRKPTSATQIPLSITGLQLPYRREGARKDPKV
jgi:hypothetical protein